MSQTNPPPSSPSQSSTIPREHPALVASSSTSSAMPPAQSTPHNADSSSPAPKGQKRKRLSKACDACHKSKRRCDGTAPCANCDFAGKSCSYSDSLGRPIPPPRVRSELDPPRPPPRSAAGGAGQRRPRAPVLPPPPPPAPTVMVPFSVAPTPATAHAPAISERPRGTISVSPSISDVRDLAAVSPHLDPYLTQELVNLFFAHMHLPALMIHRPTFLFNLTHNKVPPFLLNSVFALAAPRSARRQVKGIPPWRAGEGFAKMARSVILDDQGNLLLEPSIEVATALCLLQIHDCTVNKTAKSNIYFDTATRILNDLRVPTIDTANPFPSQHHLDTVESWIHKELCRRVWWFIRFVKTIAAAFGQGRLPQLDRETTPNLPVSEANFELGVPPDGPQDRIYSPNPRSMSEFTHLVLVTDIYYKIVKQISAQQKMPKPPVGTSMQVSTVDHERALDTWHLGLPPTMRFTDENWAIHMSTLGSGMGTGWWTFTFMHAIAACSVLAMRELKTNRETPPTPVEEDALRNLRMLLEALFSQASVTLSTATLLLTYLNHAPNASVDARGWCEQYENTWGVSVSQMKSFDFRQRWTTGSSSKLTASIQDVDEPPPSYDASPLSLPAIQSQLGEGSSNLRKSADRASVSSNDSSSRDSRSLPSLQSSGLLDRAFEIVPRMGSDPLPLPPRRRAPIGMPWLDEEPSR